MSSSQPPITAEQLAALPPEVQALLRAVVEHYERRIAELESEHAFFLTDYGEAQDTIATQQARIAELETTQRKFGKMQHEFMSKAEATIAAQAARIMELERKP